MKCPVCEKENKEDEVYCEDCGAELNAKVIDQDVSSETNEEPNTFREIFNRYRIMNSRSKGKANVSSAIDLARNEKEVIIFEKPVSKDSIIDNEPLKIQWDFITRVNDPRFPVLVDLIMEDEKITLISEIYPEESIAEVIKKGNMALKQEELIKWGGALCDAINQLHMNKLLHRDIQPFNLFLLPENSIFISGFDRICHLDNIPSECEVTAGYSAPEAYGIGEGRIDERSDIYSIGASLYFVLAGKTTQLEQRENFFSFPPLSLINKSINPQLENVIMKAVSKKPEDRYQTAGDFKEALNGIDLNESLDNTEMRNVKLKIRYAMKTNIGNVREINQDSCMHLNFKAYEKSELTEIALFIVADGMGGEAEGEKASSLAIRAISRYVLESFLSPDISIKTKKLFPDDPNEKCRFIITGALKDANRIVFEYAKQNISRKGMGSTISAAIIKDNILIIGHAGDTRVYFFRESVEQLSEDHSLVGRLVKIGQLKKEEALKSPQRSIVYRALGTNQELDVDNYNRELKPNDFILICSDGVWEYFPDEELLSIFKEYNEPQVICDKLIELCLARGADDNCTAIVIRMDES